MNKKFDFKSITIVLLIFVILVETVAGFTYINNLTKKNSENIFYHADTIEEINELKKEGKPLIVVFGADYCPMCINYKPYVKEFDELFSGEVIVKYIDTVEHEAIRKEYNIELVPSTLFFDKNGEPFNPSSELSLPMNDEIIEERNYISEQFKIANNEELNLNNQFEFGITENKEIGYCKYVGILDLIQLEEIFLELIRQ